MSKESRVSVGALFDLGFHKDSTAGAESESLEVDFSQRDMKRRSRAPSAEGRRVTTVLPIAAGLVVALVAVGVLVSSGLLFDEWNPDRAVGETWSLPFAMAGILLLGALVLGMLATIVHFLRQQDDPLYWELACWGLVVIGIVVRQVVADGYSDLTFGSMVVSAVVGVAILPGLMRWLNRVSEEPGLQHVTVPFSLGFFVDLAQTLASTYVVALPWIPT